MKKGFSVKAYIDLTRAHFFFVWPILFLSGLALAYRDYGGFSWELTVTAALIGLFGFVAGLVLNDYVDRDLDKRTWKPINLQNTGGLLEKGR
jgi:4-hydroxybenzoate polyprenyltransferase